MNDPTGAKRDTRSNPVTPPLGPDRTDWQAECQRLRQRVQELEVELRQERQALAAVRKERDAYRPFVYAAAKALFAAEDWTTVPDSKDCLPLEAFLGELDQIVDGPAAGSGHG